MQGQGLKSVFDFNNLNIMGFVDPIVNYTKIMSYKNDLCNFDLGKIDKNSSILIQLLIRFI